MSEYILGYNRMKTLFKSIEQVKNRGCPAISINSIFFWRES